MALTLKPQTLERIESQMKQFGFDSADDFVEAAIGALAGHEGGHFELDIDDLDAETTAVLSRADEQIVRGEVVPWPQVEAELKARFGLT
jgi:hypothetical protein